MANPLWRILHRVQVERALANAFDERWIDFSYGYVWGRIGPLRVGLYEAIANHVKSIHHRAQTMTPTAAFLLPPYGRRL